MRKVREQAQDKERRQRALRNGYGTLPFVMATPVITPAAPASAAASVSSTAPVSTPSVASTPTATPTSTESSQPLTSEQSVQAMVAAVENHDKGLPVNGDPAKPAEPAAAVVPAATPEAKVEEPPAAVSAQPTDGDHSYSLEEDGFVGARDLASKLDSNEALKAALPPELRNELMANARLAEVGAQYRELFSSPEEAKIVSETAQSHAKYLDVFNSIQHDQAKGTDSFIRMLIEESAIRNDDGSILRDENGRPKTDGTAGRLFDQIFRNALTSRVVAKIENSGDESAIAALDLVMERAGLRPSTAAEDPSKDPAIAAREATVAAREKAVRDQEQAGRQETQRQYSVALEGDITSVYDTERNSLLSLATGLSPLERSAVEQKLDAAVVAARKASSAYQLRKDAIRREPMSAARRQKEVNLVRGFLRDNLARIAKPILAEAGVSVGSKAKANEVAAAARADNARSEVNGGSVTAAAATRQSPQDVQQLTAQITQALTAKLGRAPSDSELNIEMMLSAAKARGFGNAA